MEIGELEPNELTTGTQRADDEVSPGTARIMAHMEALRVQLDDSAVDRLRRRAEREGIDVSDLASRLLAEASEQDPFEFVGAVSSGGGNARRVEEFLEKQGFGSNQS